MIGRLCRIVAFTWLVGANGLQFALSIRSRPYMELERDAYELRSETDRALGIDPADVEVWVRTGRVPPLDAVWIGLGNVLSVCLLVIGTELRRDWEKRRRAS